MPDAETVIAVVPTFNRERDLRACLSALRAQTRPVQSIVVVDNGSTDGTAAALARSPALTVITLPKNLGGSGGFRVGIEAAVALAPEWIWVMDDDCWPETDALERLLCAANSADADVAGILPRVIYGNSGSIVGHRRGSIGQASSDERDWGPFLGALFRTAACNRVAPVRDDFYISNDDTEYCLRMRLAGWRFLAEPRARVSHPATPVARLTRGARPGRTVMVVPPWKEYYDARNRFAVDLLFRGTKVADPRTPGVRAMQELKYAVLVALVDREHGIERMIMRITGLAHAFVGVSGPVVAPGQTLPTPTAERCWTACRRRVERLTRVTRRCRHNA